MPSQPCGRLSLVLVASCMPQKIRQAEQESQPSIPVRPTVGNTELKSLAQIFGQRIIADVLDVFLPVVAAYPAQVGVDLALVERRIHIHIQVTPDGIRAV